MGSLAQGNVQVSAAKLLQSLQGSNPHTVVCTCCHHQFLQVEVFQTIGRKEWVHFRGALRLLQGRTGSDGYHLICWIPGSTNSIWLNCLQQKGSWLLRGEQQMKNLEDLSLISGLPLTWLSDFGQISSSLHLNFFICKKRSIILRILTRKNNTLLKTTLKQALNCIKGLD